ncbi:hypothetical protein [Paenibacillus tuaregi]|uniref:hypothetical protein n=1 Tax=Paenibacillus tuaregi TaxID=1816681 RepID=UPI0008394F66|nr:hypothetical protein [Paenibacillus tuaregi]
MKLRQLLECTVDLAHPSAELTSVISAVLSAIPSVEERAEILRRIDDEIVVALAALEEAEVTEEEPADGGNGRT